MHGKNKREHDKDLELVLKRLHFKGVTLNKQKCQFNLESIEFLGHVFNRSGVMADPDKMRAIKNAEAPTSTEKYVVCWVHQIMFPGLFLTILQSLKIILHGYRQVNKKKHLQN